MDFLPGLTPPFVSLSSQILDSVLNPQLSQAKLGTNLDYTKFTPFRGKQARAPIARLPTCHYQDPQKSTKFKSETSSPCGNSLRKLVAQANMALAWVSEVVVSSWKQRDLSSSGGGGKCPPSVCVRLAESHWSSWSQSRKGMLYGGLCIGDAPFRCSADVTSCPLSCPQRDPWPRVSVWGPRR